MRRRSPRQTGRGRSGSQASSVASGASSKQSIVSSPAGEGSRRRRGRPRTDSQLTIDEEDPSGDVVHTPVSERQRRARLRSASTGSAASAASKNSRRKRKDSVGSASSKQSRGKGNPLKTQSTPNKSDAEHDFELENPQCFHHLVILGSSPNFDFVEEIVERCIHLKVDHIGVWRLCEEFGRCIH